MNAFIESFHFLRPLWLMAIPALWVVAFWVNKSSKDHGTWEGIIDAELLAPLTLEDNKQSDQSALWALLAVLWSLACIALAGPSWQYTTTKTYRASGDWLIVLDLSTSMTSNDLRPDRASRARYAISDILEQAKGHQVGLIAFSGDAYTIVPLTSDVDNIRLLLAALKPSVMPEQGDNLAPALKRAVSLLNSAKHHDQRIIVISDGVVDNADAIDTAKYLASQSIKFDVIGIGRMGGRSKSPQVPPFRATFLQALAKVGKGDYYNADQLKRLTQALGKTTSHSRRSPDSTEAAAIKRWSDGGIWLLPVIVLLSALLARRGWL